MNKQIKYGTIQIDEDKLYEDIALDIIKEMENNPIVKEEKEKWEKLKKYSQMFYQYIDKYGENNVALKDLSNLDYNELKANIDNIRVQYKLLNAFAIQIDNYFGREVVTLFIRTLKNDIKFYELNEQDNKANMTSGGRLTPVNANLLLNKNGINSALELENIKVLNSLKNIENAYIFVSPIYRETMSRFDIGQSKAKNFYSILWKNHNDDISNTYVDAAGNKWSIGRIYNRGDITEAYAAALLKKGKYLKDITNIESQIGRFYNYYITKVDSMAAILGPDIEDTENGVGYAIKAPGSRPASLNQYYQVAKFISSITNEPKNLLKKIKQNWPRFEGAQRNKKIVANEFTEELGQNSVNIIESVIKEYYK